MLKISTVALLGLLICSSSCKQANDEGVKPPNIILIMADDMGYSDSSPYGGEINTPNLEQLAANGLRFTQFYNTARCCPTRASLLTGLYPQQAGIGHMVDDRGTIAYRGDLSKQAVTIAEVLKASGYATYLSGKWHVTPYIIDNPTKENWPRARGFDRFFGMISGAGSFYDPRSLTLEDEYVAPRDGFYATTDFTDQAVQYIKEHQTDNPYFLYLAYTAPHWPLQAPRDEIAKYKGKYDQGWDSVRSKRYERMKKMGLVKKDWQLSPRDSLIQEWDSDIEDRDWEIANMETYAAMIDIMDQGIGKIIATLKAKGELENTMLIFLQDNGACAEELGSTNRQIDASMVKPMKAGAIQTEMIPFVTRDGNAVRVMREAWPGPAEGYTAYGRNWANASNTPFREYKHWVHEGGISSPLIVHWPEGIVEGGGFRESPAHLIDIMATCVDAAGANYPINYNGKDIQPMEGQSLLPVFDGKPLEERPIYWEHEGNRAVRLGKWKLVSKAKDPQYWDAIADLPIEYWELYNMEKDRTETNDIAKNHSDQVLKMSAMWMDWAKRTGTVPRPKG